MKKFCVGSTFICLLFAGIMWVDPLGKKGITDYISARVKVEDQRKFNRYIITGGPGVGKTTIANTLKTLKGFAAIDEAATRIIVKELSAGIEMPWAQVGFNEKIVTLQNEDRAQAAKIYHEAEHLFFDRSPIDAFSYCLYHKETPSPKIISIAEEVINYFNPHVFLVENFGECEQTAVRPESVAEAKKIEEILERSYASLGFHVIRVKPGTVEERINYILSIINH